MKHLIRVLGFVSYLLAVVGLMKLLANITAGIEVNVGGELMDFNSVPIVVWIFGMAGLYISVGTGFLISDYLGRAWDGEEENRLTKTEMIVQCVLFTAFFFVFSFVFRIFTIDDVFGLFGWLFMAATCVSTVLTTAIVHKAVYGRRTATAAADSEVR